MHVYSTGQWALLFYFYCLCGWVWESCYVSLRQHRWTNRGFLRGPLLPIYGSGAIIILFATLPVREHLIAVYFLGTLSATALEYVVGAVMERLFTVRYWDYSAQRFNLNGYICLSSSVAWGFFSVLLVRWIHPPVERLLIRLPALLVDPLALAATALFAADTVTSFQAAMDLRALLERITEENEELRRLAKRAEVAAAFAGDELREFHELTALNRELMQNYIEEELAEHRAAKAARRQRREERLTRRLNAKADAAATVAATLERALAGLEGERESAAQRAELQELAGRVRAREAQIRSRTAAHYRPSLRILTNNPTARAKAHHAEAMDVLKKL